jgi:phage shock protein PspC (stress-responsive transcriptional regulator)
MTYGYLWLLALLLIVVLFFVGIIVYTVYAMMLEAKRKHLLERKKEGTL